MDKKQQTCFKRRLLILGGMKAALISSLVGRLFYMQCVNKSHYEQLSNKNRLNTLFFAGPRGAILDRKGIPLALNHPTYQVLLNVENPSFIEQDIFKIKQILGDINEIPLKLKSLYVTVKMDVSFDKMAELQLNLPQIPRLVFDISQKRFYPYPEFFGHIIGHIGVLTESDVHHQNAHVQGVQLGKMGIEKNYDANLQGQIGQKIFEVDAAQRVVRILRVDPSQTGNPLFLTLDFELQKSVYQLLAPHERATAIVMDPKTGRILSCVSYPGYNTNLFNTSLSKDNWNAILNDPGKPLLNRAIQGVYPPGSVFKMMVLLSALHRGVISEKLSVSCPGFFDLGSHRFYCHSWKRGGHGHVSLKRAIAQSCDVFFYYIATKLPLEYLVQTAHEFGFSESTGIDIPSEKKGLMPTAQWKKERFKAGWTLGDSLNLSIGQGYLLATPMQVVRMMSILVNGGHCVTPHFCKDACVATPNHLAHYKPEHLALIMDGMYDVVNTPYGTAKKACTFDPTFEIGGKTGSSQVSRITQKQRDDNKVNERPYHLRDHAFFAGYAPSDDPRYVVFVLIEHGTSGGKVAAPVARDILLKTRELFEET